ncbi:hypothetical protein [Caulobacter sp. UC70_42]|uniref:hypothetical protein n=1 Tax=Caulobacter sp. UC70_42 TaxID=3374551 RepID=UPI003757915C
MRDVFADPAQRREQPIERGARDAELAAQHLDPKVGVVQVGVDEPAHPRALGVGRGPPSRVAPLAQRQAGQQVGRGAADAIRLLGPQVGRHAHQALGVRFQQLRARALAAQDEAVQRIQVDVARIEGRARQGQVQVHAVARLGLEGAGEIQNADVARSRGRFAAPRLTAVTALEDDLHHDQLQPGRGDLPRIATIGESAARHVRRAQQHRPDIEGVDPEVGARGVDVAQPHVEDRRDRLGVGFHALAAGRDAGARLIVGKHRGLRHEKLDPGNANRR